MIPKAFHGKKVSNINQNGSNKLPPVGRKAARLSPVLPHILFGPQTFPEVEARRACLKHKKLNCPIAFEGGESN